MAFRFTQRETATGIFILSAIAIWGTLHGFGPFVGEAENPSLLALQSWTAVLTISAIALSAGMAERGRAQEALRESEERFRIVADAAPVFIWMSGVDKLCTFFNKSWLEFTGRTIEQEMGNGWAEGVHPDDFQRCLKVYTEAFDARKLFVMQYRLRRHDGEYRWISDTGVPRYDTQKNFDGYIGSCVDVTEFINKEQALRDSEERMSLAAKAAGFIVWSWDIARDEVWLSDKDRALFGFSQSEKLNAERVRSVVYPEDRHLVSQLVQNSLTTEKELEAEYRIVLGDSKVRWVTRRGRVEFDGNGEPTWERGVLMDITELKGKEEALREFEERVVLAAETAHLGVWELDTATGEIWMSDSARSLFGLDSNTHLTHDVLQNRLHPDDRARRDSAVKAAIENYGEYELEYRTVLPDGSLRWIGGRGRCVRKGNSTHLIGVSIDITERKQAEEKFRLAVEASPSGIVLVDSEGKIVLVNAHVEELFGYRREELVGKLVDILVPERLRAIHPAHRGKFVAKPEAVVIGAGRELFARRKDGSEFPVEIGLNPIDTPDGMLVLAAVVDISARKIAEAEALQHREELGHLSRVAVMGEMAASIAHELNQPLSGIISNASAGQRFIDRGNVDLREMRDLLADIIADGRRAGDVIRGVRSMVKKSETARHRMDLNKVVMKVVHLVKPDALLRSCTLETVLAPDLPAIEADPTQLQQVLINLVINAFDAMRDTPLDGRKVVIATERSGDGTICTSVRDYGVGISEEKRGRLFEQFFTTKAEGLGMGLSIVRSIVESHGGTVTAENADGGGAQFRFTLPANAAAS
jgi:PAS domain S-box-containing protein